MATSATGSIFGRYTSMLPIPMSVDPDVARSASTIGWLPSDESDEDFNAAVVALCYEMPAPYLLDTTVLLHWTRNSHQAQAIDANFQLSSLAMRPLVCEVSLGEMLAFSLSRSWGTQKPRGLAELERHIVVFATFAVSTILGQTEMVRDLRRG